MEETILQVKDLCVEFQTNNGVVKAVRGINYELKRGETLAIVGESGSGKSVSSRAVMKLLADNGKIASGDIIFKGQSILNYDDKKMQSIRGKEIAMIFQDPMTSLDPTMSIGTQLRESVMKHLGYDKKKATERAIELLDLVGIPDPASRLKQYPHQFSGGMRQRVVIAIALSCNPEVLICDEPTTALDVTIQAQILELINDLQEKLNISVIFITHDLGVVANMADRVAVMYAGKIVEIGTCEEVFYKPVHPYTWGLLASMPELDAKTERLYAIPGTPPNMLFPPKGDAFALRSEYAMQIDLMEEPPLFKVSDTHFASTWLLHELAPKVEMPASLKKRIEKMAERGEK